VCLLQPHYKDDETSAFPVYEDLSDTPEEEDIENDSEEDEGEDEEVAGKAHVAWLLSSFWKCMIIPPPQFLQHFHFAHLEVLKGIHFWGQSIHRLGFQFLNSNYQKNINKIFVELITILNT